MAEEYVFSASGLAVGYQGKPLIRDIQVKLPRGKILTLIGPNGAGKSTILKTITRQLSPVAGTAYIDQRALNAWPGPALSRRLAVVLTERIQPEMMTCFDVAAMGRYPYTGRFGALSRQDRALVESALSRVRALDIAGRDFSLVSDGQRQRVLLARALCQEPEILVLDEPTSFLDIRHKIDLLDILLEESRLRNLTVILSLHEIDLAEKISDWVMCVKGDKIWRLGSPEDVFRDKVIAELYGLEAGSYLTFRGSVELRPPEGEPKVFVLGGGGCGVPFYRALQKRKTPFSAGVLFEFDREFEVARALGRRVVSVPAFEEMGRDAVKRAEEEALRCGRLLDAGAPIGALNGAYREIINFAREKGVLIAGKMDELD